MDFSSLNCSEIIMPLTVNIKMGLKTKVLLRQKYIKKGIYFKYMLFGV